MYVVRMRSTSVVCLSYMFARVQELFAKIWIPHVDLSYIRCQCLLKVLTDYASGPHKTIMSMYICALRLNFTSQSTISNLHNNVSEARLVGTLLGSRFWGQAASEQEGGSTGRWVKMVKEQQHYQTSCSEVFLNK